MRAFAGVAALALALAAAPAGAAGEPDVGGPLCGYVLEADPTEPGMVVGEIEGGPVYAIVAAATPDDALANPVAVTLTCSIGAGWDVHHDDPMSVSASASGPVVAVLPPTPVRFPLALDEPARACARVTVTARGGETRDLYWDGDTDAFSTDPTSRCDVRYCTTTGDDGCGGPGGDPIGDLIDDLGALYTVDEVVCPVLAALLPPDGDVEYVWDCPPYGTRAPAAAR